MLGVVKSYRERIAKGDPPSGVLSILLQSDLYKEMDKDGSGAIMI